MKTNSNSYTIVYAAVLVVIVAFLLAFVFQALRPHRKLMWHLTSRSRYSILSTSVACRIRLLPLNIKRWSLPTRLLMPTAMLLTKVQKVAPLPALSSTPVISRLVSWLCMSAPSMDKPNM